MFGDSAVHIDDNGGSNGILFETSTSIDLTDIYNFSMAVMTPDTDNAMVPELHVMDSNYNYIYRGRGRRNAAWGDQWLHISLGPYDPDNLWDDTADPTDAQKFRFELGDGLTEWYLDEVRVSPTSSKGYLIITFDDNPESQYTEGFAPLSRHGFAATAFVNPDTVGDEGRLSLDQLREMQSAGWDIASHTPDHQDLLDHTSDEQEEILREAKDWLLQRISHADPPWHALWRPNNFRLRIHDKEAKDHIDNGDLEVLTVSDYYERFVMGDGPPVDTELTAIFS